MTYTYKMRTDKIFDEDDNLLVVYGIELYEDTAIIKSIPDISFDRDYIEHLVMLCNTEALSPIHLMDIIEDALT